MEFTAEAQAIWDQVPDATRARLLDSGFCAHCLTTRHFELTEGEIRSMMKHAGAGCPLGPCKGCAHHDATSSSCCA